MQSDDDCGVNDFFTTGLCDLEDELFVEPCFRSGEYLEKKKKEIQKKLKDAEPKPIERTKEEWDALFPFAPTTNDGYMQSYKADEPELYLPHLEKYGFVVVSVLSDDECQKSVEEFFIDANLNGCERKKAEVTRQDPMSWETCNWPSKSKYLMDFLALGQQAFNNRQNENIYKVYSEIYQTHELWSNIDVWGVMRGTRNLEWKDETGQISKVDKDNWKVFLLPHWDNNPALYWKRLQNSEARMYQSLVAIDDCPEEVGGFLIVPCSVHFIPQYITEHKMPHKKWKKVRPPPDHPMLNYLQKVPLRKGEMVIWDSGSVYCNFPNNSSNLRLIQFIRQLPAKKYAADRDRYAPQRVLRDKRYRHFDLEATIQLTDRGRKLFALDDW